MKTRCSEYEITEAMIQYGGSFVSQLARLIRLADHDNKRRLVEAFPEYVEQYDDLAAKGVGTAMKSASGSTPEAGT